METKTKACDAVAESRKWREATSRKLDAMPVEERLAYFKGVRERYAAERKRPAHRSAIQVSPMTLRIVLIKSEGGLAVGCPALPGCWSQGETREEALANIREAIALWLEVEEEYIRHELEECAEEVNLEISELLAAPAAAGAVERGLKRFAGAVRDLPSDMARNHDHYLHGRPKK